MFHLSAPAILVFLAFALVNGSVAYYCWMVIQRARRTLRSSEQSKTAREQAMFGVIVMFLPLSGFSFGFFYFFYKTLQALWALF
jgi:hypothetical protein